MRSDLRALRLALALSTALHLLLAGLLVFVIRAQPRVSHQAIVEAHLPAPLRLTWREAEPEIALDTPVPTPVAEVPVEPTPPPEPSPSPAELTGLRPEVLEPRTLPRKILDRIRRASTPSDAPIVPVAAVEPSPPRLLEGGAALHGALVPGQTIVYVLDASGSMGQAGKFERARKALAATLREQPADVRFQVVVYAGFARGLLPGGARPAIPDNVEQAIQALAGIEPVGRSAHADALRLATNANPEFVLLLTDAEIPASAVKEMTSRLARPPVVTLAIVREDRIEPPRRVFTR